MGQSDISRHFVMIKVKLISQTSARAPKPGTGVHKTYDELANLIARLAREYALKRVRPIHT
jgi:hypothetical protein